jgi:alpha-soluble NSF attachment protein
MSALANKQKQKAQEYLAEAEKTLAKKSWFGGSGRGQEDAAELYAQAANAFKVGGLNNEAGSAYCKAGELNEKLGNKNEAAKCFSQAGKRVV